MCVTLPNTFYMKWSDLTVKLKNHTYQHSTANYVLHDLLGNSLSFRDNQWRRSRGAQAIEFEPFQLNSNLYFKLTKILGKILIF